MKCYSGVMVDVKSLATCWKHDSDSGLLKCQEKEENLKAKHNDKYTLPQLRLWS